MSFKERTALAFERLKFLRAANSADEAYRKIKMKPALFEKIAQKIGMPLHEMEQRALFDMNPPFKEAEKALSEMGMEPCKIVVVITKHYREKPLP